jgi:hypothetical protein
MAPCSTFVSLVRSCYRTTMNFFTDVGSVPLSVTWYFTDPGAKWCGLPNVFNSRNWYLTDADKWPDLGEVQGAPRPWADGSEGCLAHPGPFGTADQWLHGAAQADALASDPCFGARDFMGFGTFRMEATFCGLLTVDMVMYGDRWSIPYPDPVTGPDWLTAFPVAAPQCCFARGARIAVTGPPPAFTVVRNLDIAPRLIGDCAGGFGNDPVTGCDVFLLADF